jgi:hypothetical protein
MEYIIPGGHGLGYLQRLSLLTSPSTLGDLDIAEQNFRRSSKGCFQTKPLPAWSAGTNSPLLLGSRNSMLPGVIPTSRNAVPNAAVLGRANSEVPETPTDQAERCIRQFVPSVAGIRWFPSCLEVTSLSTVAIASAR